MKVVVVLEDALMRKVYSVFLKKAGIEAVTFENGIRAMEYIEDYSDDIEAVITDYFLPFRSGLEILHHIKQVLKLHMPVIMVSGVDNDRLIVDAYQSGLDDFIRKPISTKVLTTKLGLLIKLYNKMKYGEDKGS